VVLHEAENGGELVVQVVETRRERASSVIGGGGSGWLYTATPAARAPS
jgi:hypothetical protein